LKKASPRIAHASAWHWWPTPRCPALELERLMIERGKPKTVVSDNDRGVA
jgi:hypothetical protein